MNKKLCKIASTNRLWPFKISAEKVRLCTAKCLGFDRSAQDAQILRALLGRAQMEAAKLTYLGSSHFLEYLIELAPGFEGLFRAVEDLDTFSGTVFLGATEALELQLRISERQLSAFRSDTDLGELKRALLLDKPRPRPALLATVARHWRTGWFHRHP